MQGGKAGWAALLERRRGPRAVARSRALGGGRRHAGGRAPAQCGAEVWVVAEGEAEDHRGVHGQHLSQVQLRLRTLEVLHT